MPKDNVCVERKSVLFSRLQSILLIVLRRVYLSLVNNREWRKKWVSDATQLHKGFKNSWKLYLNLCLLKWLKPRRTLNKKMKFSIINFFSRCGENFTEEILNGKPHFLCSGSRVISLISSGLWLVFNLFHSEMVDRKKEFFKKLCFNLKFNILCTFLLCM